MRPKFILHPITLSKDKQTIRPVLVRAGKINARQQKKANALLHYRKTSWGEVRKSFLPMVTRFGLKMRRVTRDAMGNMLLWIR